MGRDAEGLVRGVGRLVWLAAILACLAGASPAAADITYVHDELGRLRAVIDPSQTDGTTIFSFDSVGNILSVVRQPSSQVAIIEFHPKSGPVGTTVTLQGTGFSPSQNAVTVNGVATSVTSATPTQLVTTIPATTTGLIGVTVSGVGSASSAEPFTVTAGTPAPTITGISPTLGTPGTTPVQVSGASFEPTPALNNVRFEGSRLLSAVASATTATLQTTAPAGLTASGPISVQTPFGTAVSSQDFFIPVGSYTAAQVATTLRMAIGQTQVVSIPATKIALIIFDGTAGQGVSFRFTGSQITSGVIGVYHPDGTTLFSPIGMGLTNGFIDTKTLPASGVYALIIDPDGALTGDVTVSLFNAADVAGTISPGGAAVPVTNTTPGQNIRLTFSGTAGQRVSLRATAITLTSVWLSILKPDGTTLSGPLSGWAGGTIFLDAVSLPTTGVYTVFVDPSSYYTGGLTLTLYEINDLTGTISLGGTAVPVTIATPGQNARLTFAGATGQRISLFVSSVTITSNWVTMQKPDGTALVTQSVGPPNGFLDVQTLPTTGTYTILLDPFGDYTGNATFALYEVPADVTGTITAGGAAVPVSTGTPGQNATLTFSGVTGQRISLRMTAVTYFRALVSIKNPDGSTLVAPVTVISSGGFIDATTLSQTGTYSIFVNPDIQYTGAMTLTLYDVPADVTGTLILNDPAVAVPLTTPGQNGSFTFSGTASQQATVRITGNTIAVVIVTLKKPDGNPLIAVGVGTASYNLPTQTLPTTGTYTVTINPDQFNTGSLNLSVTSP